MLEGGEAVLEGGEAVLPHHQGDGHLLLAHQGEAGHLQGTHIKHVKKTGSNPAVRFGEYCLSLEHLYMSHFKTLNINHSRS